jgi:hypothetical protein
LYKQWEESFFCNTFLDIVYTPNYYAEFLHNIPTIDYHHLRTRMETYLKEKQVQPTQTIEANYMIAPNIW